jgi:hypothetical protein
VRWSASFYIVFIVVNLMSSINGRLTTSSGTSLLAARWALAISSTLQNVQRMRLMMNSIGIRWQREAKRFWREEEEDTGIIKWEECTLYTHFPHLGTQPLRQDPARSHPNNCITRFWLFYRCKIASTSARPSTNSARR